GPGVRSGWAEGKCSRGVAGCLQERIEAGCGAGRARLADPASRSAIPKACERVCDRELVHSLLPASPNEGHAPKSGRDQHKGGWLGCRYKGSRNRKTISRRETGKITIESPHEDYEIGSRNTRSAGWRANLVRHAVGIGVIWDTSTPEIP